MIEPYTELFPLVKYSCCISCHSYVVKDRHCTENPIEFPFFADFCGDSKKIVIKDYDYYDMIDVYCSVLKKHLSKGTIKRMYRKLSKEILIVTSNNAINHFKKEIIRPIITNSNYIYQKKYLLMKLHKMAK